METDLINAAAPAYQADWLRKLTHLGSHSWDPTCAAIAAAVLHAGGRAQALPRRSVSIGPCFHLARRV